MAKDLQFIIILLLSTLLPFGAMSLLEDDTFENPWQYDMHLNHFDERLGSEENPDIVFFGSSRTMNNIDALYLNTLLKEQEMSSLNLGVNWFGMGLQNQLVHDWLEKKQPKLVVLETPMLYRYEMHPNFNKRAEPREVLLAFEFAPWKGLRPMLSYTPRRAYQELAKHLSFPTQTQIYDRDHRDGHVKVVLSTDERTQLKESMQNQLTLGEHPRPETNPSVKQYYYDIRYRQHLEFQKNIVDICQEKKVELILLNYPKIRLTRAHSALIDEYQKMGTYLEAPAEISQQSHFYRDLTHMTEDGAHAFTKWFYEQIQTKTK